MKYSYFYLMCVLVLSDFILLALSVKHREKTAVKSFIALMTLSAIAHIFYGASLIIPWVDIKLFVHELKFIGVAFFSTVFYKMYMELFDKPKWASRKFILSLMIVPSATVVLALTNNNHHLFRKMLWVIENDYGSFVGVQSGPLFWVYLIYTYLLYIFCLVIVARTYLKTPKLYRMQIGIMIYAAVSTLICNFISISGIFFEDFGDATLVIFAVAAVIQFYGLVMYKPVGMIRMARDMAVNEIKDPVVIFDYNGWLFDVNSAASQLFVLNSDDRMEIGSFFSSRLGLPADFLESPHNCTLELDGQWYTLNLKRIMDSDGVFTASALIMSDITEIKRRERKLESMAYLDYTAGIGNRYAYMRALSGVGGDDLPVVLVRMNISGMKLINSTRGNDAGDAVIKDFAAALTEVAGENGFCARIEGDEFALLLKNSDKLAASEAIAKLNDMLPDIGLSYGIAVMRTKMENINIVDKASVDSLYMKKLSGNTASAR